MGDAFDEGYPDDGERPVHVEPGDEVPLVLAE